MKSIREKTEGLCGLYSIWQSKQVTAGMRMNCVGDELLTSKKSMSVNSLTCVKGKVETFRINSGVRQWCVMSPRDWEEWEQDLQMKGDGGGG